MLMMSMSMSMNEQIWLITAPQQLGNQARSDLWNWVGELGDRKGIPKNHVMQQARHDKMTSLGNTEREEGE